MKTNEDILSEFGELVVKDCFDPAYANLQSLRQKNNPPEIFKDYVSLLKKLNDQDFVILKRYLKDSLEGTLHDFLKIFEDHHKFKIIYDDNNIQVDLNEISEMLKAEPLIEGGWIEKFSDELSDIK